MKFEVMDVTQLKDLGSELIGPDGKLLLKNADEYAGYSSDEMRYFCHKYARYGLVTKELIGWLIYEIGGDLAIEIGSGHGDLGAKLGIQMTDSYLQGEGMINLFYKMAQQTVIKYPADVEELEALDAVEKYQPEVVVASWVTEMYVPGKDVGNVYGVDEIALVRRVKKYILIGNTDIHGDKEIMKLPHSEFRYDWLMSRSRNTGGNRIWVWRN